MVGRQLQQGFGVRAWGERRGVDACAGQTEWGLCRYVSRAMTCSICHLLSFILYPPSTIRSSHSLAVPRAHAPPPHTVYDFTIRTAQNTTTHKHERYSTFLALHTRLHCRLASHLHAQLPPVLPKAPLGFSGEVALAAARVAERGAAAPGDWRSVRGMDVGAGHELKGLALR